ncbi:hypothetical protein SCMU_29470 [Sinomonas cyclohexanicum]|uniref:Uncharacterized protein n=1 Tax=Sinomonas cyclohexanicum TaxID=322009 RepID=A0ABN6FKG8_SINCY|nr:hypothetical protein SCMU_29470 [Corynebacterium cyclohexanicum]
MEAFQHLQGSVWEHALADVKVWRSGYVLLVSGVTGILAFVGTQLASGVAWYWRLALALTLGAGVILVARALIYTLRIGGGATATSINLPQIVQEYNSVEMYRAQQAATALEQLDRSKKWAGLGAACCLVGLICALWMTSATSSGMSPQQPSPSGGTTTPATPAPTP